MNEFLLLGVPLAYLALLFILAHKVEHRSKEWLHGRVVGPAIYSLSLAVYCTTWTFFGAVGRATEAGVGFFPTYLGPILVFLFCTPVITKILLICKNQNITSISDFISSRYGKCQYLAGLVATIALLGIVPYIALQLKAVAMAFDMSSIHFIGQPAVLEDVGAAARVDTGLWVAVIMALFVMLFATRTADASVQHSGLVASIAFESIVKLAAFSILGFVVCYFVFDGIGDVVSKISGHEKLSSLLAPRAALDTSFVSMTILSGLAVICLPRQFHMTFVENTSVKQLQVARWAFPAYLILFSLLVIPIALAGDLLLRGQNINADAYVLGIPILRSSSALILTVFIGGLAAATGMIIVETLSLATMLSNDIALPLLTRTKMMSGTDLPDMQPLVLGVRRSAILLILALAYGYMRLVPDSYTLVNIGLISFLAIAQFAPLIIGGIYWSKANRLGAISGLSVGTIIWATMLFITESLGSTESPAFFSNRGAEGQNSQATYAVLGINIDDPFTYSAILSLTANIFIFVVVSLRSKRTTAEILQAPLFIKTPLNNSPYLLARESRVKLHELRRAMSKFVDGKDAEKELFAHLQRTGRNASQNSYASEDTLAWAERMIGGVIGSAMSKTVINSLRRSTRLEFEDAADLLSDATDLLSSNWERFRETLENINQGILMFDSNFNLAVWNNRAITLLDLPPHLMIAGTPFEELVRYNTTRGEYGNGYTDDYLATTLSRARSLIEHRFERSRPNGAVLEIFGKALPSGGFVSTFTDITERKKAEIALKSAYEELEVHVEQRTKELKESKERFREMVESSSDWYWETDAHHRFTYISNRFFELTQFRSDQIIGMTHWEIVGHTRDIGPALREHKLQMENQKPFRSVKYSIQLEDSEIHIRISGKPVFSDEAEFIGYRGTATDVTATEKAEQELLRSEKLAALGGLVAGIAHEINTPVGIGLTAATYLQGKTSDFRALVVDSQLKRSDLDRYISLVEELSASLTHNLKRAAQLVKSFKQVAVDQSTDQTRSFNLREYINEILTSLGPKIRRTPHSIDIKCPDDLVMTCNPGAISQIFTNLIINSITHAFAEDEGGKITISVSASDKNDLSIIYEDNGRGIPQSCLGNVFQPFFTTKRGEGGSGLGLHIIYNLVTQSFGGRIDFSSTEGRGVRFSMWLPGVVLQYSKGMRK